MDLARTDQVIETTEDFVHRCHAVGDMGPEQVEMVGLEALQAFLDGTNHVLAVITGIGNAGSGRSAKRVFACDHEIIALRSDEIAQQHFRLASLVTICSIEEVATGLDVAIENLLRFVTLRAVAPAGAEVARTQCQLRNAQSGSAAKCCVAHVDLLACAACLNYNYNINGL
ncbi:hypothetical protein D9M68_785810 [compost metagenome]